LVAEYARGPPGAIGSFAGARINSIYMPGKRLKQGFGVLIVLMTGYEPVLTHESDRDFRAIPRLSRFVGLNH
jgi:hypothetical protein